jgi:predicted DNA-binding protein with PD1-like motif
MRNLLRRSCACALLAAGACLVSGAVPAYAADDDEDRITPVVGTVIAEPEPVLAADGRRHLAYELQLVNRSGGEVTVQSIETLAGGAVVGTAAGQALAGMMLPYGAAAPGATLHGGQAAFVLLDVSFPASAKLPRAITHRLTVVTTPADPTVATTYETAPSDVGQRDAVVVAPPLRGDGWVVGNGCCDAFTAHRGAVLPVNGALHVAERFAIDFVQLDDDGLMFHGPATSFDSYDFFGDPVMSATAGKVVGVVDDLPETPAGTFPEGITAAQAGGNHVVVAMGKGRFAFYAHLQPGSVTVEVGDTVKPGEVLGLLGNSGNSDAPHLHFHIMDGPRPLSSNGLPYRFSGFTSEGTLTNLAEVSAGEKAVVSDKLKGSFENVLPLDLQVIGFG